MKIHTYAAIAALSLVGVAHGQNTLDWANTTAWSNGTTTGSYNTLSGAGSSNATINPLTYDFGGGLTATVTAVLNGAQWQNGSTAYGGYAPRTANGVFALGVNNATSITGATLTLTFNQAVLLDSFTTGDLDSAGSRDLVTVGANNALFVQNTAATGPTIANAGTNTISLTGITGREDAFNASAVTAWTTLDSGTNLINSLTVFLAGGTSAHGIWLSDVTVSSPIPEPATYALLLGFGTFALIVVRRRWLRRA